MNTFVFFFNLCNTEKKNDPHSQPTLNPGKQVRLVVTEQPSLCNMSNRLTCCFCSKKGGAPRSRVRAVGAC